MDKLAAETVVKMVEAVYSSVQADQAIATLPSIAPVADEVLKSAGFVDQNAPPILLPPETPPAGQGDVTDLRRDHGYTGSYSPCTG